MCYPYYKPHTINHGVVIFSTILSFLGKNNISSVFLLYLCVSRLFSASNLSSAWSLWRIMLSRRKQKPRGRLKILSWRNISDKLTRHKNISCRNISLINIPTYADTDSLSHRTIGAELGAAAWRCSYVRCSKVKIGFS